MKRTLALVLVILVALAGIGAAQGAGGRLTPEQRQAILDYQLTLPRANALLAAMDAMTKYVVSLPDYQTRMAKTMTMTPAERRAQMENDPKASTILKQNGLTAQDYLVGVVALRQAVYLAQPGPGGGNLVASPANLAFAKAHLAELKPKLDAVDGIGRK
jgi:hypothetical protein